MKFSFRWALTAMAVILASVLVSCGGKTATGTASTPPADGTLVVALLGDIGQPPDPDVYYAANGLAITLNVYEGLVQYKNATAQPTIAPRLATEWTVSSDHKSYTFKLRPGVTFHDGTPFNADAVKASFDRRLAVAQGPSYMVADATVTKVDDLNVKIQLKLSNAAFLDYLASPYGPKILSPTGLKKNAGADFAQTYLLDHDLGTGPYELTEAKVGTKYGLTQYGAYWGTKSPFTKIDLPVFKDSAALELALDHGEVHATVASLPSSSIPKYDGNPQFGSYFLPTLQATLITTNPTKAFFAKKDARLAFMKAIDQNKLVSQVGGKRSVVATTLYAKGMIEAGADKQTLAYDPAPMEALVKSLPKDTPLVIGYVTENVNAQLMANIVAAQLIAMGLKATAQGYPISEVFGWANDPTKGPDAFIDGNNGPDGGNPYMWGHVFWDKTGGIDYFLADVPETSKTLDKAVKTNDTALFIQAAQTYAAEGYYLHLSDNYSWVVAQKWLGGIAESQNVSANELDFSLLTIVK